MITLDQVYLLEQKVESAVEKIQQLQAENDALILEVTKLKNALSSKSEQLSSFESDQNQIEVGIKKALDRLSLIENSVLKAVGQAAPVTVPVTPTPQPVQPKTIVNEQPKPIIETIQSKVNNVPSFDTMETISESEEDFTETSEAEKQLEETVNFTEEEIVEESVDSFSYDESPMDMMNSQEESDDENTDELGFDIF